MRKAIEISPSGDGSGKFRLGKEAVSKLVGWPLKSQVLEGSLFDVDSAKPLSDDKEIGETRVQGPL